MKQKLFLVLSMFAFIACIAGVMNSCRPDKSTPSTPIFEDPDTVSVEQPSPSIEDVLQARRVQIQNYQLDSMWLHMPENTIVCVLMHKGTDLCSYEIVEEYLANREYYDSFTQRNKEIKVDHDTVTIKQTNDAQKNYLPI